MKVLVIADGQYPPQTQMAGNKAVFDLQRNLARLGVELHVLTFVENWADPGYKQWFRDVESEDGIRMTAVDSGLLRKLPKPFWKLSYLPAIAWMGRKHRFDVVHQYASSPAMLRFAPIYRRLTRAPVVYTFCSYLEGAHGSFKLAGGAGAVEQIVCTSDHMADEFRSRYPEQVMSVRLGGDLSPFFQPPEASGLRKRLDIPAKGTVVLYLAPLETHKGIFVMLDAFALLMKEHPDAHLVVATSVRGDNQAEHDKNLRYLKAHAAYAEGKIRLLDGKQDVPQLMSLADVIAVPLVQQHHTLGLPLTLIEAMASGTSVVASAVEGNIELLDHEMNGLVVPPGDPHALSADLARLLREPALRERLGRRAQDDARPLDSHNSAKRMMDVYESVLSGGRSR